MTGNLRTYLLTLSLILIAGGAFAQEMPHENLDFECDVCHSLKEWSGVRFDHADSTGFVLDGRHSDAECAGCHTLRDFAIIDTRCISCHKDIHEGKLGPECDRCHTTDGFGIFNVEDIHAETNFPLMGRHALADCQSCHTGLPQGDLSFNTTRCVGCHQQDYLEVTSPNHVAAGFPTECDDCHQMSSWRPALMTDHDIFFPIFSGEHAGEWDDCSTCHTETGNFQVFSCFGCHEHNRANTDEDHEGIPGYVYNSQDCLLCHPTGSAGQFLQHDALYFPIYAGVHDGVWDDCSECHTDPNNRSVFSCTACHTQAETNPAHGGIPSYVYESSACFACHPTGEAGEFLEHDVLFFPIYTGEHDGTWADCGTCHNNPDDRSQFTCLVCHDQTTVDNVHAGITGYVYNSDDCYACHPNGEVGEYTEHINYFPIYSGPHTAVWDECIDCHPVSGDKTVFDCLPCHGQSATDLIHSGMPGYVYSSPNCFDCHPTGESWEYVDHDITEFPIFSGTHAGEWTFCSDCHFIPTDRTQFDCLVCHVQGDIDPVHLGMVSYSYESSACYSCHPNGVIEPYYEHDDAFFPIYSGTHDGRWASCATCHIDPADKSVWSCLETCHDQTPTDNRHTTPPPPVEGYVYESSACFSCHPNGIVEP